MNLSNRDEFLTSRAGSPAPFRPVRPSTLTTEDLQALDDLSGSNDAAVDAAKTANAAGKPQVDIEALTRQADSQ